MRCTLCDTEGTVRTASLSGRVILTVTCAAHELACIRAVASGDYVDVAEALRWRHPDATVEALLDTARTLATMRVIGLHDTDRELVADMLDAARAAGPDEVDSEWAVLETMRKRGMK